MKYFFKIISVILVLSLFALMAVGSGSSSTTSEITSSSSQSSSSSSGTSSFESSSGTNSAITSSSSAKAQDLPVISEQVILDMNGVKVTAKEYVTDSIWGDGIKVLIENNTSQNIGVGCNALIVNNYMISDLFSSTVAGGKKANDTIYISSSELKDAGIDNIGQIELYLHLFDGDTYKTLADAPCATIRTSLYEKMDTTPNDAGQELYNQNGIKIVGKYVSDDSIWGKAIMLYIENHSGQNVTVTCDNLSVNGFMFTPLFSCTVYDGKMAIDDISLLSSELEENGITSVDNVELIFRIYDPDTFHTLTESGPISFSTK